MPSFFNNLFGKKKTPTKKNINDTIINLKSKYEHLEKKEKLMEYKHNKEIEQAKKYLRVKNKKKAIECMKRSKLYENNLDKISGMKYNLDNQIISLEQIETSTHVVESIKESNSVMKQELIDLDKVEDIKDDMAEHIEDANEMSNILSEPITGEVFDEDDLMDELELLDNNDKDEKLETNIEEKTSTEFPSINSEFKNNTPEEIKSDDEKEFNKLLEIME